MLRFRKLSDMCKLNSRTDTCLLLHLGKLRIVFKSGPRHPRPEKSVGMDGPFPKISQIIEALPNACYARWRAILRSEYTLQCVTVFARNTVGSSHPPPLNVGKHPLGGRCGHQMTW